ncbi:MAG: hypothetical protein RL653_493 [Pseudomonadota bacterium]|jgi:anion-transporting  ArsA/GET3 family ATPase
MSEGVLARLVREKSVLVCVGPGGVGKTTVSATLALEGALSGRSALVCTIDPARRLANALGMAALGNTEARIPDATFEAAGLEPGAPLHAMMLDMKQAWDALIRRYAPADKQEKILSNRFYQSLSTALAGSQEYVALEKLWELSQRSEYGLVVLDTPPTSHALDFLDAPTRILDFLDNDAARLLLTPALAAGRVGLQLFSLGSSFMAKTISRLTGAETLQELAGFLLSISSLNQGFRERAHGVRELLTRPDTAFLLVTAPSPERLGETLRFHQVLREQGMNVGAVVVNRVHAPPVAGDRARAQQCPSPLREQLLTTLAEQEILARLDAEGLAQLRAGLGSTPLVELPRFDRDIHDLRALHAAGRHLLQR